MIYRVTIVSLLLASVSQASQVLQASKSAVAISHPSDKAYSIGDAVCIVQNEKKIGCGRVAKVSPKGAIVRLSAVRGTVNKGDSVVRVAARGGASASSKVTVEKPKSSPRNTIGAGFLGSQVYQYLIVFYERALGARWSFRVEPTYFLATLGLDSGENYSTTTLGAKIGVSFHSSGPFEGFWVNTGVGFYSFSIAPIDAAKPLDGFGSPVGSLTLGYRVKLGKLFSLGLLVGGQYLKFSGDFNVTPFQAIGAANLSVLF